MSNVRTGIQKTIWLHVSRHGGTWTPDEIAALLKVDRQRTNVAMQNMTTRHGSLKRFKVDGRTAFAVTPSCRVPSGVTVAELNGVGAGPKPLVPNSVFQLGEATQ